MTASISILQLCCFCIMSGRLLLALVLYVGCGTDGVAGSCVSNETPICCRGALHVGNTSWFCLAGHSEMCDVSVGAWGGGGVLHSWLFGSISLPVIDFFFLVLYSLYCPCKVFGSK